MLCVGLNFGHNFFRRLEGEGVFELFCERGEGSLKPNLLVFSCGEGVLRDVAQYTDWMYFTELERDIHGNSSELTDFVQKSNAHYLDTSLYS